MIYPNWVWSTNATRRPAQFLLFGAIVTASNAGGAGSVIGDTTTTMILKTVADRSCLAERRAHASIYAKFACHPLGDNATRPIARRSPRPALLLVLAGGDPASSPRLAGRADRRTLGHIQLRFLG